MEKRYVGVRIPRGPTTVLVATDSSLQLLDPRHDLWNHSPDGFEWGYCGSGPAQLALALLADATGFDGLAVILHQRFKRDTVAKLQKLGFEMRREDILAWVLCALDAHLGATVHFSLNLGWEDDPHAKR